MKRKVLITGASRGIGKATALQLAQDGYFLILHASQLENLTDVISRLPEDISYETLTADFSDEIAVKAFIGTIKKHHKDLYGIVSNAGITLDKPLAYQPESDIDTMLQVNLKTPILLAKAAMKMFGRSQSGVFIAVSSCVGEMGNAFQSVYAASKAGNVALCKSLAKECGALHESHSIRFLSVSPGFIETDMVQSLSDEIKEKYVRDIPANRTGKVEEVAKTMSFLLSDAASYINGSEIKVNGGML